MDWNKLKAEYIAGGTSYRKLAEKYDVKLSKLRSVAASENWQKLKAQTKHKTNTKIINSVANDITRSATKINSVADKLLDKISHLLNEIELADSQTIKQCTSALKDIKDIKGVKSDIDLKEQNARIEKLRKEIDSEQTDDRPCGVVLMPDVMESLTPPSEVEDDE